MTPNEYQTLAMTTKADPVKILARLNELGPAYLQAWVATNGLTNEVGEISDIIKAAIEYGRGPVDKTHVKEEIGDAVWRLCQLADAFGLTLEDCLTANLNKLQNKAKGRYKSGAFTEEAANNRTLEAERKALEGHTGVEVREDLEATMVTAQRPVQPPCGSPADEAFTMLFEKPSTRNSSPEKVPVVETSLEALNKPQRFFTGCGFLEPPEESEEPISAEGYPGWTFAIPSEVGNYEWFYSHEPFNYKVSSISVENYSFTSVGVYYRKIS